MGEFVLRFAMCRCGHGKPKHGTGGECLDETCDCTKFSKGRKYSNRKVERDGYTFDSRREARRYEHLKADEAHGRIADLEVHPPFPLWVAVDVQNGQPRVRELGRRYEADFRYRVVATDAVVVEDSKGMRTPLYKLKKRIVEANYGIEIIEV